MKTIYSIILVFAFATTALLADGVCKVLNATSTYLYPQSVLVQTDINNQIATTSGEISSLENKMTQLREEYANMIRFAQRNQNSYQRLMFLFAAEDFNQA